MLTMFAMLMRTLTPARLVRIGVPGAAFLALTLLRTHDITRTFWMFSDQILFWDTAQLPLSQQTLAGEEQHVGGYMLGPAYNWFVWSSRVLLGPFYDNLPHAGAIGQVLLHSAIDALLLYALWRKTRSVWLSVATILLITTAPYDLALSATLWNPSLAEASVKCATALVLLGWAERSLTRVGLVASVAWLSIHFHTGTVFGVASIFVALVVLPALGRDYRALGLRAAVIAGTVALLQVPYLVHRLSSEPGAEGGAVTVIASLEQVFSGRAPLRVVDSAAGLAQAIDRIQLDPWQVGWVGWVVAACGVALLTRRRDDPTLLALTVLPLGFSVAGYALWVGTFDEYYYLPQMTAAVLTVLLGATALAGRHRGYVAIAALVLAVAVLPARVRQASTIHRMFGYDLLVEGSRQILQRGASVRAIRADFLPPDGHPEYLFTILGGTLDPEGEWVATIAADGLVSYRRVAP